MPRTNEKAYLHKEPILTNADILEARAVEDPHRKRGTFKVRLVFTKQGADRMEEATRANRGKLLAVLVDGNIVSAARIFETIHDQAALSGDWITKEGS